jgi:multiple sugar transport system permease protein
MARRAAATAVLVALGLVVLLPLAWIVVSSFKSRLVLLESPPVLLFTPTFEHYVAAVSDRGLISNVMVSGVVAVASSLIAVGFGYPAASALARMTRPVGRHLLFLILTTRLVPPVALGLPLFHLYRELGLLDSVTGLTLAHSAFNLSFAVWMLVAFFNQLSPELYQAAALDGLKPMALARVLARPMRPAVLAVGLFCAVLSWDELFLGSVLTTSSAQPLTVGVLGLITSQGTYWGQVCAFATVSLIPALGLGLVLRRASGALLSLGTLQMEDRD